MANNNHDDEPNQVGRVPEYENDGWSQMNTVPLRREPLSFSGVPVLSSSGTDTQPPVILLTSIGPDKPGRSPLVYGIITVSAVCCVGFVSYSLYNHTPVASKYDINRESQEQARVTETKVQTPQPILAEVDKQNTELQLRDEAIKESRIAAEKHNEELVNEAAAIKLKVAESEKMAQSARVERAAEIERTRAKVKSKELNITKLPKEQSVVQDAHLAPTVKQPKASGSRNTKRPSAWVRLVRHETDPLKGYCYFVAPDGFVSELYPSQELAIYAAEARRDQMSQPQR